MPLMTTGPKSWLDDLASNTGLQRIEPVLRDLEQKQQTAAEMPPVETPKPYTSFSDSIGAVKSWLDKMRAPDEAITTSQPQAMPTGAAAEGQTAQMSQGTGVAPERTGEYRAYARQVAAQYGVDPDIFERQINQESGFNPSARSPVGAAGIAQFMPGTAAGYGVDVNDPYSSLDGAARHMRDLLKANGGNYRLALAAYNAGQGNVDKWGEGVFGDDFANGQTRDYVNIILGPGSARPAQRQSMNAGGATSPAQPASSSGAAGVPPASSAALPPTLAQAFKSANGREPTPAEAAELSQAFGLGAMA